MFIFSQKNAYSLDANYISQQGLIGDLISNMSSIRNLCFEKCTKIERYNSHLETNIENDIALLIHMQNIKKINLFQELRDKISNTISILDNDEIDQGVKITYELLYQYWNILSDSPRIFELLSEICLWQSWSDTASNRIKLIRILNGKSHVYEDRPGSSLNTSNNLHS